MTKNEFLRLSEKYLAGEASAEEQELLRRYRDRIELLDDVWEAEMGDKEKIYGELSASIFQQLDQKERKLRRLRSFMRVAAVLLVAVSVSVALWKLVAGHRGGGQRHQVAVHLPPADDKAFLTLADGTRLALGSQELDITTASGINVGKSKEGELVYTVDGKADGAGEDQYNIISTPQGGHYSVILPDSTRVWLNAASSLKFPLKFKAAERVVEVSGEAFFDVRKDEGRRFVVKTGRSEITVLGTRFNVSDYPDDDETSTTLVEGAVMMKAGSEKVRLAPGMKAVAGKEKALSVELTSGREAIAWRNGLFVFESESIVEIMKQLSRWYDVEVTFGGTTKEKEFTGSISRFKDITEVLEMMKLAGGINYKIEGRRIVIMD